MRLRVLLQKQIFPEPAKFPAKILPRTFSPKTVVSIPEWCPAFEFQNLLQKLFSYS